MALGPPEHEESELCSIVSSAPESAPPPPPPPLLELNQAVTIKQYFNVMLHVHTLPLCFKVTVGKNAINDN